MALRQLARALAVVVCVVAAGIANTAQAQNWDGSGLIRFGVFLQGANVDYSILQTTPAGTSTRQSVSPEGFGAGISAGYDVRFGSVVVGAEADVAWDDANDRINGSTGEQYGTDYYANFRGRLGFLPIPELLVYGTAGYGLIGAEYKLLSTTSSGSKRNATLDGFVYGGGLEYDLGWGTLFGEYLHGDYGTWSFRNIAGTTIAAEAQSDIYRLGLKFKVGHDYTDDVYRKYGSAK